MKKILSVLLLVSLVVSSWAQPSKPLDLSVTLLELNNYQLMSQKGAANGYAPLDSNSLVPPSFIFPGFVNAPDGTIWSKSGTSFGAISNLSIQPSGITAASITKLGQLTIPGIITPIFGVGIELSTIPLTLYGGNSRVYIASGQTIGAADVGFNNFTWSINPLGNFDLNSGAIKGGLSMSNSSISNVSSVSSPSGLSINFTNNRIVSLVSGKDIIFSGNDIGVQVPDVDTNALANPSTADIASSYALNKRTADIYYPQKNGANTWIFTQTFSNGIVVTPAIPITSGGTGATNASQARQNLGIVVGTTNGLQAWSPVLANLSSNTPVNNNFIIGSGVGNSAAWVSRTPSQVRTILGIQAGVDTQPYSDTLQYIVNTVTNNTFNQKYIFVGDQINKVLIARPANLARADLGLEINATNGVLGFSSYLRDIANLGIPQTNEFIVGTGSTWSKRSATQVREIISAQPANIVLSNVSDSSYVGDDNISLVGTITNGTWDASTISVSRGGTGATNQSSARDNIGLGSTSSVSFGTIVASGSISSLSSTVSSNLSVGGSISVTNAAQTRTNLGLGAIWLTNTDAAAFRTAIGIGSSATNSSASFQPSSSVLSNLSLNNAGTLTNLTASSVVGTVASATNVTGIIEISNGGTGANSTGQARTNLGATTVGNSLFTATDAAAARSTLVLGTAATNAATAFQPASSNLTNLASNNGGSLTNLTAARVVGTVATASNVTGVVAISNGGTGANSASTARSNIGLGNGITTNIIFADGNSILHTINISNGIITSWSTE